MGTNWLGEGCACTCHRLLLCAESTPPPAPRLRGAPRPAPRPVRWAGYPCDPNQRGQGDTSHPPPNPSTKTGCGHTPQPGLLTPCFTSSTPGAGEGARDTPATRAPRVPPAPPGQPAASPSTARGRGPGTGGPAAAARGAPGEKQPLPGRSLGAGRAPRPSGGTRGCAGRGDGGPGGAPGRREGGEDPGTQRGLGKEGGGQG